MNKDEVIYIDGLRTLRLARRAHKKTGIDTLAVCVVSFGLVKLLPPIALMAMIKVLFYMRSAVKTTRMKCPRCKKPFSTKAFILPFAKEEKDACTSCGLSMRLIAES